MSKYAMEKNTVEQKVIYWFVLEPLTFEMDACKSQHRYVWEIQILIIN